MEKREIKRLAVENEDVKRQIAKIEISNSVKDVKERTLLQEDEVLLNDFSLIKTLKIYATEDTGVSVSLDFLPEIKNERYIYVTCNGYGVRKLYGIGEISGEIPVFLNKGENLFAVEIYQEIKDELCKAKLAIEVVGFVENRPIESLLTPLNDYLIGLTKGDTISVYTADLSKLILTKTRNDGGCVAYEESYGIMILHKDVLTSDTLLAYYGEDGSRLDEEFFPHQFSSSAIIVISGRRYVYTVKDNQVYKIEYDADKYAELKIPFKAKKISAVVGVDGNYLSYVDLKDNFVTVTLDGYANPIAYKSWGKLENAHVDDVYGELSCTYKFGKIVAHTSEKNSTVYPVGVGDELVRVNKEVSILRKGDKLIQLKEEL